MYTLLIIILFLSVIALVVQVRNHFLYKRNYKIIMAKLEDFEAILNRVDEATNDIAAEMRDIKEELTNAGLPADVEDSVLARLEATAQKLEAIAGETPEDEEEPTEPVDEE